ncbi:MAG: hypothetical protein WAX89_00635, partial [Alphaproteobacteria bacterium]
MRKKLMSVAAVIAWAAGVASQEANAARTPVQDVPVAGQGVGGSVPALRDNEVAVAAQETEAAREEVLHYVRNHLGLMLLAGNEEDVMTAILHELEALGSERPTLAGLGKLEFIAGLLAEAQLAKEPDHSVLNNP